MSDRQRAIKEGRKFYIGKKPHHCGCVVKYVSSYGCHYCAKKEGYEKLMSGALEKYQTPEMKDKKQKRWRENNYEKYQQQWLRDKTNGVRQAKRRATKRNQTPNLTPLDEARIMYIYDTCKKMTEETGIPHEVDHIIPICKGGWHHPDNLQILTKKENRVKGGK